MYDLPKMNYAEATKELYSLASVSSYSACIANSIRFLAYILDIRQNTQNSDMSMLGIKDNTFYG